MPHRALCELFHCLVMVRQWVDLMRLAVQTPPVGFADSPLKEGAISPHRAAREDAARVADDLPCRALR